MTGQETLLLLENTAATQEGLERLSERYRVVASFPPKLVVVNVDPRTENDLWQDADIRVVIKEVVPEGLLSELSQEEQVFIQAWVRKRTEPQKQREGDGLAWDAPGLLPPDPPNEIP
jgi:hypothetical protein